MREIKFRGQCKITKDFVIGDLIHGVGNKAGRMFILPIKKNLAYVKHCHPLDGVEVIPETIGQYMNFKDKNELEVYTGDIVKASDEIIYNINEPFVIKWRQDALSIVGDNGNEWLNLEDLIGCEIIGNIHLNPELL